MRTTTQGEAPVRALHSRRFKMIIFDWDGTAVASRAHPADGILWRSEALLDRGVWLAAVTGTSFANLSSQFASRLNPSVRQRTLFCTNRGSEVYGFSADGHDALRLHVRVATEAEDEAMDRASRRIQHELREQYGLETQIIHGRMNRRKLDLIPLPQWADPLKEQLRALHRAVEARLASCGVSGGLAEIVARTRAICADEGIDARVTTDVKHVELGLTDKSDSVRYLIEQVAKPNAISASEILILGDEFGPIGGVEGSDHKLLIPAVRDSLCISVGSEPCGVPAGVVHLGGGADTFADILEAQMRACRRPRCHSLSRSARPRIRGSYVKAVTAPAASRSLTARPCSRWEMAIWLLADHMKTACWRAAPPPSLQECSTVTPPPTKSPNWYQCPTGCPLRSCWTGRLCCRRLSLPVREKPSRAVTMIDLSTLRRRASVARSASEAPPGASSASRASGSCRLPIGIWPA